MPLSLDLLRVFSPPPASSASPLPPRGTTQPAVSQQIKRLEKELATPLFQRASIEASCSPTRRPAPAPRHVAAGLETIDAGIAALGAPAPRGAQVATDYAFAAYWLMPRLPRFHQAIRTWT